MMKEKNMYLDIKVGVYAKSTKGFRRISSMPLREVLQREAWNHAVEMYRDSKTEDQPKGDSDLKRNIKAYQPSGDYGNQSRSAKNKMVSETNLVQLDFDCKIQPKRIKDLFNKYKWVAVAAKSCGGQGFYLLVHTETSAEYGEYFAALYTFFMKEEKLEVDRAVASINEIRFVSLTTEVLMREDATIWNKKEVPVVSTMEKVHVPLDGKLIDLPEVLLDESGAHYYDIVSWAGKQNINGVPLAVALEGFPMDRISPKSSCYKRPKVVQLVINNVYDRYSEQHGIAVVTDVMMHGGDLDLPHITFDKNNIPSKNAQLIVDTVCKKYQFKTDFRTLKTYRFVGTHWVVVEDYEVKNFLTECAVAVRFSSSTARMPRFREMLLEDLKDRTHCLFDTPAMAFNVKNGIITFVDGDIELKEHSDEFNFTYILDYDYDPSVKKAKVFETFMTRILPIQDTHRVFYQYIGAAFLPKTISFEKTLILMGSGSNGKSTLMNLIESLFGDAVGTFNLERLTDPKDSSLEASHVYGKLFGVCREGKQIKDTSQWKTIVSKEKITVKYLYKDTFVTDNYGRLITCMNEAPNIDSVFGSMRRVIILGMNVQIPETEQDQKLSHKLSLERTAILNHIIQGYKEIYKAGGVIFEDETTKAQTMQVIDDQDLVLNFVRYKNYFPLEIDRDPYPREQKYDRLIKNKYKGHGYKFMPPRDLYKEFLEWCKDEGNNYPLGKLRFLSRLRTLKGERLGYEFICKTGFESVMNRNGMVEFIVGVRTADISNNPDDPTPKKKTKNKKDDVPF